MTGARLLPLDVTKEIRALLPTWLACMTTIGAATIFTSGRALTVVTQATVVSAGVLAYILGCAALGALSIGHEYSNRTLPLLLSLPASRRRLFTVKLTVLTAMLLGLSVLAMVGVLERLLRGGLSDAVVVGLLSFLGGLFLAPWLTMVCRNPLAGAVFAIAIEGSMLAVGELVAILTYGASLAHSGDADRVKLAVASWGMLLICAAAAVASWRMFMRLEAIDGRDSHIRLPHWLRGPATLAAPGVARGRGVHPMWWLARKELHLQQLTFVVAGIYLLGWIAILRRGAVLGGTLDQPLLMWTVMFGGVEALLSGSLASAEERQFGTLEAQVLLPMATAKQWAVKAGVALGLTLSLAVGLPFLLASLSPTAGGLRVNFSFVGTLFILTVGSLYVSSLCTSGVKALLLSLPGSALIFGLVSFFTWVSQAQAVVRVRHAAELSMWLSLGLAVGFLAMLLWFAMRNHRSGERGVSRVWPQAIWMAGYLLMGVSVVFSVLAFY